jgi:alkylation response protein AidB-like acyl-CoA dehydrogenase
MDFNLTEEQALLRKTLRDFCQKEVAPIAASLDQEERFPAETFRKMAELGLLGISIPKEYGGGGADFVSCVIVMTEIARSCAATALSYGAHAFLCTHNLYLHANAQQRQRYLPRLAAGQSLGAFALTEPEAGSDALSLQTRAQRKGEHYFLSGTKTLITNGPVADIFLVAARLGQSKTKSDIGLFIVEKRFEGFSVGKNIEKMGTRGSPTSELIFSDCKVPVENLLGQEGMGAIQLLKGLDIERVVFSGMPLGIAQAAFEAARSYAHQRKQFGKELAQFEMIQEMLANMAMNIEAASLLIYKAAQLLDDGKSVTKEASFAKLFGAEMVMRTTLDAVQIFGGYGYTREFQVERLMRDAKLISLGGGTNQIQQLIIAREILKEGEYGS